MTRRDGGAVDPGATLRNMRIAFVGKGGSGKSVVVGTFARLLARRGEPVLVLDSDVMPGLAFSLGAESTDAPIPAEAVEETGGDGGPRYRLRADLSPADAVERYAHHAPDGVRLLQLGKLRDSMSGEFVASQHAFRQISDGLADTRWHVVGDLPGGTRQPFFGWGSYADTVLVVVEPTAKSMLSARRLRRLSESRWAPRVLGVANKTRRPEDRGEIAARTGLEVVAAVPRDDAVAEADRRGVALIDHDADSPAVAAVRSLLDHLAGEAVTA